MSSSSYNAHSSNNSTNHTAPTHPPNPLPHPRSPPSHHFPSTSESRQTRRWCPCTSASHVCTTSCPSIQPILNSSRPDPTVLADSYHRYHGSYSFANQEYVEAVAFHHFITTGTLITLGHIQQLIHNETDRPFQLLPADYLLGLLDLPGEMMRYATNNHSLYPQLLSHCYEVMQGLDRTVSGLVLRPYGAYSGKLNVMRDSIQKLEKLEYRRAVREEVDETVMAELIRGWGGGLERKRGLEDEEGGGGGRGPDEAEGGKRARVEEGDV